MCDRNKEENFHPNYYLISRSWLKIWNTSKKSKKMLFSGHVHTSSFPSVFTTVNYKNFHPMNCLVVFSRDEVYAGFRWIMSRSQELFETIRKESARKRHRMHAKSLHSSHGIGVFVLSCWHCMRHHYETASIILYDSIMHTFNKTFLIRRYEKNVFCLIRASRRVVWSGNWTAWEAIAKLI